MDWNDHAESWDEKDGVQAYSEAAFASLERACRGRNIELEGARVLDFGCGTGLLSEKLSERCASIIALDSSKKMIEACRAKKARLDLHRVRPLLGNLTPDFVAESEAFEAPFDLIVCSSVCAFLDDYPGSLALLARQLRPGGLFVQWDWELDPDSEEPFGLSRDEVRAALEGAGLTDVSVDTAFRIAVGEDSMSPLMGVGISPIAG